MLGRGGSWGGPLGSWGGPLGGHLGDRASALVDGQLSVDQEQRAWHHVESCGACQVMVQRETWMKQRLSGLSGPVAPGPAPHADLLGSLYDGNALSDARPAPVGPGRTRRAALAAAGAGSVGAAVLGLVVATGSPAGLGEPAPARQAPARIGTTLLDFALPTGASSNRPSAPGGTGASSRTPAPR